MVAIGPLLLGPLSEIFGRSRVVQLATLFYLAWNIGCGFAQNTGQLVAFRFLAGLGGSAPLSIGGAMISDTWGTHERGKAIAIYSIAPLLGPIIGPVAGAWIAEKSTWRWVFWSTSILCVAVQILGLFFLHEIFLTTIPLKFGGAYHQPPGIAGLHYVAIGIGFIGASQINARVIDPIYAYLTKKNADDGRPDTTCTEC
ncbi:hypothetical protein EYR36_004141 [Pleurotus pulmonarius]|nr:hypothetical protein EYR36_004141 [Pleurotus pulmonarius]